MRTRNSRDEIPQCDRVPRCGVRHVCIDLTRKAYRTTNAAGFYLLLLALFMLTSILNANSLAQAISEINRKYWTVKLMVGARAALYMYYLQGNVIYLWLLAVYINLQPEYELVSTRFGKFQNFGNIWVGTLFPAIPKKKNSARVWVLVYIPARQTQIWHLILYTIPTSE